MPRGHCSLNLSTTCLKASNHNLVMHWSEVWEGRSTQASAVRTLLTPASWLYEAVWRCYRLTYSLGFKKAVAPHRPIVCIGGLAVGGSGKTPVALHIADVLVSLGHKVVLSTSGYASPASEAARVAPTGPLDAREWGDEASMIRWLRPSIPLIVGRRRVLAAQLCHRNFADAVMLMDDGFQHLPLKKHLSILLIDENGFNHRCLPAGPFREPYAFRREADLVLPGQFTVTSQTMRLIRPDGSATDGKPTASKVICALGQPEKFVRGLVSCGIEITEKRFLPDHDSLAGGTLFEGWPIEEAVVVTAKDWVKLCNRPDVAGRNIWVADYQVIVEPKLAFRNWIEKHLNEFANTPQKTV